jgi:hypothetical protein
LQLVFTSQQEKPKGGYMRRQHVEIGIDEALEGVAKTRMHKALHPAQGPEGAVPHRAWIQKIRLPQEAINQGQSFVRTQCRSSNVIQAFCQELFA